MPRRSRFVPRQTHAGWELNIPADFARSGKRERHYYPTRAEAIQAAKALRESKEAFGAQSAAISPTLADEAVKAEEILKPYGISLVMAARRIAEIEDAACQSFPIEEALEEFIDLKSDRSHGQQRVYRYMQEALLEDFTGRLLSSIRGDELLKHARSRMKTDSSFNARLVSLKAFWSWAAKKPREWCRASEIEHLEMRETEDAEIGVLSYAEALKLMKTAEKHFPETCTCFALMLFMGIRGEELKRLSPDDITAEGVSIPAAKAKTKRRRFIAMSDPVRAWVKAYPATEAVCPPDWVRKFGAVRMLSGWKVKASIVDLPKAFPTFPEWPKNALRHTAATMALALGKPIESLVFEHGHVGNLSVLRNHYIGRMTRQEAESIWSIQP